MLVVPDALNMAGGVDHAVAELRDAASTFDAPCPKPSAPANSCERG